jgi:hypothetical protein
MERIPSEDAGDGGCVIDNDADIDATPCEILPGEYIGILRHTGGNCEESANLDDTIGAVSVSPGVSCGVNWYLLLQNENESNCAYATLYMVHGDETGLLPGSRVTVNTSCHDGYGCVDTYTINLEPISE